MVAKDLGDYPHTFDHTLEYVVSKFGKLIPYIVADPAFWERCQHACVSAFGFYPPVTVQIGDYGFTEMPYLDTPWDPPEPDFDWDKQQLRLLDVDSKICD